MRSTLGPVRGGWTLWRLPDEVEAVQPVVRGDADPARIVDAYAVEGAGVAGAEDLAGAQRAAVGDGEPAQAPSTT
ncbi:hypothetical protein [Micromonospora sp. NPDC005087]|uniref:hypothetical protein n=1 Tax=Micromonospora sp. NPDC005087 TaxID=3364225 RepID=UPI0036A1CD61